MGKAARTRRSEQRKKQKRARKDQQRALYQSYKNAGTNKKSKRNSAAKRGVKTVKHAMGNCGNVGCEKKTCYPHLAMQRMNDSNDPRSRFKVAAQQFR